jgi:hypothetical protein
MLQEIVVLSVVMVRLLVMSSVTVVMAAMAPVIAPPHQAGNPRVHPHKIVNPSVVIALLLATKNAIQEQAVILPVLVMWVIQPLLQQIATVFLFVMAGLSLVKSVMVELSATPPVLVILVGPALLPPLRIVWRIAEMARLLVLRNVIRAWAVMEPVNAVLAIQLLLQQIRTVFLFVMARLSLVRNAMVERTVIPLTALAMTVTPLLYLSPLQAVLSLVVIPKLLEMRNAMVA